MVIEIPHEELSRFLPLFSEHKYFRPQLEAIPIYSFGKGYTDNIEKPDVLLYSYGNLWFLTGSCRSPKVKSILEKIPERQEIFLPHDEWVSTLRNKWEYVSYVPRTKFSSEGLNLDDIHDLNIRIPEKYQLLRINKEIAEHIFPDFPGGPMNFLKQGMGFCIIDGEDVVCWSAAFRLEGDEIGVFTSPGYRGHGFAVATCAKVIEYCLERDRKPNWNASNEISVRLALKLGFTDPERYKTYFWRKNPWNLEEAKEFFEPRYQRGLHEANRLKSENKEISSKLQTIFADILTNIDRLIIPGIVDKPTGLFLRDLKDKVIKIQDEISPS